MATLTIKNMPDELYATLTRKAKKNRRSINSEAIFRLEQTLKVSRPDVEESIRKLRKLREKSPKLWASKEDIDRAKSEGRL
jgi:plasmid stability protein